MKKILTVDDSASVRQMVSLTLTSAGYQVTEASDGRDGLARITRERFDLVLTDLNMPVMDGIELIGAVRKLQGWGFVPILMLTTESQPERKAEGRKAGATGWIVKPFNAEQLVAAVRKLVP